MTHTGRRGADTRGLGTPRAAPVAGWLRHLHAATALPTGVLLAGRSPAGHAVGGVLAVAGLGAGVLAVRLRPRPAVRGAPAASGLAGLAGGAVAGAGLGVLPGPVWATCAVLAGLMWLIGYLTAAGPRGTATARTVLTWSAAPPLSVLVSLVTRPEVPFAALAALDAAALALLVVGPDPARLLDAARAATRRQRPGRGQDRIDRPPLQEPWPAGRRRWVNQRTP